MTRIPFILLTTTDGSPLTGAAPTVTISKDGGAFTSATNSPAEIGNGYYYIDLTTAEITVNNNVIVRATATGAQPTAVVWEPEPTIPTASDNATAVWGATTRTVTNTIPTASDNASAVWSATARTLTASPTDISGLATSSALSAVATNVSAVKAKTDNLPSSPAAVGSEMALTSTAISAVQNGLATSSELSALETHGDSTWATATGFTTPSDLSGLSTFNAATDTVTINSTQAAGMATATGFATPSDLASAVESVEVFGQQYWQTANVSELATSSELANTQEDIVSAMPDISGLPTAADIWDYTDRSLTEEISVEISSENIADITESVWNADDRTLTDLTPKPNQKNIVCTPSNVINSYGIPRLENWTNETAGTQAFDDKINTYITLAKEKMATDLNNHINAAIDYIGADNITELCAWLTGYNLYQDDESTDTDSLPETRYNQYLEQIHRIMENI